jgi:hypothetical protein
LGALVARLPDEKAVPSGSTLEYHQLLEGGLGMLPDVESGQSTRLRCTRYRPRLIPVGVGVIRVKSDSSSNAEITMRRQDMTLAQDPPNINHPALEFTSRSRPDNANCRKRQRSVGAAMLIWLVCCSQLCSFPIASDHKPTNQILFLGTRTSGAMIAKRVVPVTTSQ